MEGQSIQEKIENNWNKLQEEVKVFCNQNDRPLPKIVAVSKTRSVDEVLAAWDCGIRHFGENYVQELVPKANVLPDAEWHFIGRLQRRNIKQIAAHADYIHSLSSMKHVNRLVKDEYKGVCLIQVNISHEDTKSGISMEYSHVNDLYMLARESGLDVKGFMGMGAFSWSLDEVKNGFHKFSSFISQFDHSEVSLGMSGDWREAILTGSTILRVGTSVFGERQQ
ncbi:MAG: YggS family pyridoxal phosphate-dependent enzyme [Candidatus Kariarchaeaceae archaeon]